MTIWERVPLGSIADVNWGDTSVTKAQYVTEGLRYSAFSASGPDGQLPYFDYDCVGVVVSAIGAYAGATWLATGRWSCIKNTLRFYSVDESVADTRYLYWVTKQPGIWPLRGSAQPFISQGDARNVEVALPPIEEQRAIAAMLGCLDDKIDSNLRSIQIQHELLSLEFQRMLSSSDKSYVPLSDVAELTKGVSYKSGDLMPSATALVTLKSIDRTGGYKADGLKPYVGPYKPTQMVKPGEIVVAQTDLTQGAEVVGRAVRVPGSPHAGTLVASLDLVIARPKGDISQEYLLGVLTHETFRQHCRNRTNGTTVLHLASDAIPSYHAPIVHPKAQESFARYSSSAHALIDSLALENSNLIALRDTLLPELLSGRVKVGDVAR